MTKIHLVYAVPPPWAGRSGPMAGIGYRIGDLLDRRNPARFRRGRDFPLGLPAPHSITAHLYSYLSHRYDVSLYDWTEKGVIPADEGDIILGHPNPDPETILRGSLLSKHQGVRFAVLMPLHLAMPELNAYAIESLERADLIFAIMGPAWLDGLEDSFLGPFANKVVRVDMAIDVGAFPRVKTHFNPPGHRGFLFIGGNRPEKGPEILSELMSHFEGVPRGWIGRGARIPNVDHITDHARLTPRYVAELGKTYDILLSTSVSDANPTTVLEAMAWGFPVAATKGSGYGAIGKLVVLPEDDPGGAVGALEELQYAETYQLEDIARANRQLVETSYTWDQFCSTIERHIRHLLDHP